MEFALTGYMKVDQDEDGRPIPADDPEARVLDTWLLSPGMKLEVSVAPDGITVVVERP